jgi:hypothetical protein
VPVRKRCLIAPVQYAIGAMKVNRPPSGAIDRAPDCADQCRRIFVFQFFEDRRHLRRKGADIGLRIRRFIALASKESRDA